MSETYGVCYWDGLSKDGAAMANSIALLKMRM